MIPPIWMDSVNFLVLTADLGGAIWIASTFWNATNSDVLARRFAEKLGAIVFLLAWVWLARIDALLDVIPGVNVMAWARILIWIPYTVLLVAMFRLFRAMQSWAKTRPGGS